MSEWKEVTAHWKGDSNFLGTAPHGGQVPMGTVDGQQGLSPMELLLASLAGCTGVDVALILGKKRANLHDLQVKVRGKRAESHPRYYTEIEVSYLVWGKGIKEKDVQDAIRLSEEKYCSVSAMLGAKAKITHTYQIFESEEESES